MPSNIPHWFVHAIWFAFVFLVGVILGYCIAENNLGPRIPQRDRERVRDLLASPIVAGECLACGGREIDCSPPYVAHNAFCPEVDRLDQIRRLLQL